MLEKYFNLKKKKELEKHLTITLLLLRYIYISFQETFFVKNPANGWNGNSVWRYLQSRKQQVSML